MYPAFIQLETQLRMAEERLAARHARRASETRGPNLPTTMHGETPRGPIAAPDLVITIRPSSTNDRPAIRRLAELDARTAPTGEMLLAIVCGELRAALPVAGGEATADPFHPTTELVELLRVRRALLHEPDADRNRARRAHLARTWRAFLQSDLSGRRSVPSHPTYWPSR
jgi:hypothetical protein